MSMQASPKTLRPIGKLAIIIVTLLVVLVGAIGCNRAVKSEVKSTTTVSSKTQPSKEKVTTSTTKSTKGTSSKEFTTTTESKK